MPGNVVGSADYILRFSTEGDDQANRALERMVKTRESATAASERMDKRATSAGLPRQFSGGTRGALLAAEPSPEANLAAATRIANSLAAPAAKGGSRMQMDTAMSRVQRQALSLQRTADRMVRHEAGGEAPYSEETWERVQVARSGLQQLQASIPSLPKSSKKGAGLSIASSKAVEDMLKEADAAMARGAREYQGHQSVRASQQVLQRENQQRERGVREEATSARRVEAVKRSEERQRDREQRDAERRAKEPENAAKRAKAEARRVEAEEERETRRSALGRTARAATWLGPQSSYYVASAMEQLGMPPGAMLAATGMIAMAAMLGTILDRVMVMTSQTQAVGAMTAGSTGAIGTKEALPGTPLGDTMELIRNIGRSYSIPSQEAIKAVQSLNKFNMTNPQQITESLRLGLAQAQTAGVSPEVGVQFGGAMMTQMGMNATRAAEQMVRFNNAVMATGGSARTATEDFIRMQPYLGPNADVGGIAAMSSYAAKYGMSGSQMFGSMMTAEGGDRISMSAMLGYPTADDLYRAQTSPGGPQDIARRATALARNLYQQTGSFTMTQSMLEGMKVVQPGENANRDVQGLLAGTFMPYFATAGAVPTPGAGQIATGFGAAQAGARAGAGIGRTIGIFTDVLGGTLAQNLGYVNQAQSNLEGSGTPFPIEALGLAALIAGRMVTTPIDLVRNFQAVRDTSAVPGSAPASQDLQVNIHVDQGGRVTGVTTQASGQGVVAPAINTTTTPPNTPGQQTPYSGGMYP